MSSERAQRMRSEFDGAFAEAPVVLEARESDLLRIRVAGERYAIRLTAVAALHAELRVVAVPTPAPELLGLAAVRGAIVAIYDLRLALGLAANGIPRWTVLVAGHAAGFAFDAFDGHARVNDLALAAGVIALDGGTHTVIDLGAMLATIQDRWRDT